MKPLAQGAEAVIYINRNKNAIIKERIKKNYRLPQIDIKLRKERTKKEASILHKLQRAGVNVPQLTKISEFELEMEFLDGVKLRDYLDKSIKKYKNISSVCGLAGQQTAKMHKAGIFHGDLTTSNMILSEKKIFLIDFGLGDYSLRVEDFAVDLHIFKECLTSKHNAVWENCWDSFLAGYKSADKELAKTVLKRLDAVELRGRYKHV
ncbi:MAG: Kae1-associated serine/threonine protein kinase [DPANN group archaeon]|nr:Kae1-associated serine/threonine protein kinase [DPANN group archaeon]